MIPQLTSIHLRPNCLVFAYDIILEAYAITHLQPNCTCFAYAMILEKAYAIIPEAHAMATFRPTCTCATYAIIVGSICNNKSPARLAYAMILGSICDDKCVIAYASDNYRICRIQYRICHMCFQELYDLRMRFTRRDNAAYRVEWCVWCEVIR